MLINSNTVASLISGLFGVLKTVIGPLLAYFQGKKVARLEAKEEALNAAKEAQKDRNDIRNLDDDSLNNIVFFDKDDIH